ncbi:MAG: hypothetical protein H6658_11560 [Ardenticatenaceae bacterium]|nr:hypothetical protein [Ardenticatenaceae bacterium]
MSDKAAQTVVPGQPVLPPLDFPVTWDDPQDAKITWLTFSQYRTSIRPFIYAVIDAFTVGGNIGLEKAGLPFEARMSRINTFAYIGMAPKAAPPEVVMKAMGLISRAAPSMFKAMMGKVGAGMSKQQEVALNPIIERFDTYWHEELLPEIKQHLAYFESSDLRGMSLDQLRAHLAEAMRRTECIGAIHHKILMPMLFAMSQFEEFYCELFAGATTLDALRLTQGFDNLTVKSDEALWQLSRTARAIPEVHTILAKYTASEVILALEKLPASKPFLAELRSWLAEYGQRLNAVFNLNEPSWIEEPTPAIRNLQAYITLPDRQPETENVAVVERETAVATARAQLTGYPQPVVTRFETLLKAAQIATIVHEDHNVWIDQRFFYHIRRIAAEFGVRLAQTGILDAADDVFYLTPEELQANGNSSLKPLVQQRKAEMAHFGQMTPPPMLGTAPPFDLSDSGSMVRAIFKGEMAQANGSQPAANLLQGLGGSVGVVQGTARVIHSLDEAGRLQSGDVLVTVATEPSWTPLFATAAAVVTDNGGVLSHTAVVAREYRIPAVVGASIATKTIRDGQLVEVNGTDGTVRILVEETTHEPALAG